MYTPFRSIRRLTTPLLFVVVLFMASGCGQLIDRDGIRIAKVGDRYITRGDLFKLIRDMPDATRPMIRNRSDLLRVLNQHIDTRIKTPLGRRLAAEGIIEVSRDTAREEFFRQAGDDAEQLRHAWQMEVPPPGVVTPLMQVYGLTPELLQFNKDTIEEETERMITRMQGDAAVEYLALEALREGRISLSEEEIAREYQFMKEQLTTPEELGFLGLRFPANTATAAAQAANIRERIDAGEDFDAVLSEFAETRADDGLPIIIQSDIVHNPAQTRFRGFWTEASGAAPGTIVGPVYLPAYQQVVQDASGRAQSVNMPDAYLIIKVLRHKPESVLSYEDARELVAAPLLTSKMMHLLRAEHGVEIYEDRLPEPAQGAGPTTTL